MKWGRYGVIEVKKRLCTRQGSCIKKTGILLELRLSLLPKRTKEMVRIDSREAMFDMSSATFQIEWNRYRCRCPKLCRDGVAPFTQPFEKNVASEGETSRNERLIRVLPYQAPHDKIEIRRFTGV